MVPEAARVAEEYAHVAERFVNSAAGFHNLVGILEDAHEMHFAKMKGRYVLTGQVRASLTNESAPGAIRQVHNGELRFGTRVEHARYLTMAPRDAENFQIDKGASGHGRSAVVVDSKKTQRDVAKSLLKWIVEPAD